jgi:hypothetical protein
MFKKQKDQQQKKSRYIKQNRNFEVEFLKETSNLLDSFVKQELLYYNSLVEQLSPIVRTFPDKILGMKDREKVLWRLCAEHTINPAQLILFPIEKWDENHRKLVGNIIYDQTGGLKIDKFHLTLCGIAGSSGKIHPMTRLAMANAILEHVTSHAEAFSSVQHDTVKRADDADLMKAPIQLLVGQDLTTKRHLQIDRKLVKVTYDKDKDQTLIETPYNRRPLVIKEMDVTDLSFNMLVIKSSHPNQEKKWFVDFKDATSKYLLNLSDPFERKKRFR